MSDLGHAATSCPQDAARAAARMVQELDPVDPAEGRQRVEAAEVA